jgi:hypothetical protein
MKKLLISLITFSLLLVVFIATIKAQLFITFEPPPTRFGLLYNQRNVLTHLRLVEYKPTKFLSKMGLYGRMYCGKINFFDFHTTNIRTGIGVSIPFRFPLEEPLLGFYLGPAYDFYINTMGSDPDINIDKIFPVSMDVGFTIEIERLRVLMMLNPYYKKDDGVDLSCSVGFSYRLRK